VRVGEQVGVATPVNKTLWHLVKAKVSSGEREKRDSFTQ
jgi:ketopantoate reductase